MQPPPHGGPPGGYGGPPGGYGGPPGGYGGPPGGYGGPPGGYGGPQNPYGSPQQQPFGAPPPQGGPPFEKPGWVGIVSIVALVLGLLMVVGTVIAGISSESAGMTMAMLTAGPLAFGIVATIMSRRDAKTAGAAIGLPLGCGCGAAFFVAVMTTVFFVAIFPKL